MDYRSFAWDLCRIILPLVCTNRFCFTPTVVESKIMMTIYDKVILKYLSYNFVENKHFVMNLDEFRKISISKNVTMVKLN